MAPLKVLLAAVFFVGTVSAMVLYVVFKYTMYRLARSLRQPPPDLDWRLYLQQAYETGSKTVGVTFGKHDGFIRRQILLVTSRPADMSTALIPRGSETLSLEHVQGKFPFWPQAQAEARVNSASGSSRKVIYGFLHPAADAGGGGERVLWAAVRQTLVHSKHHIAVVYISQGSKTDAAILERVEARFGLDFGLDPDSRQGTDSEQILADRVVFVRIPYESLVDPKSWPRLTLLGQALGDMVLGYQAVSRLMPDVFIDTAGLPFAYPVVSWLARVPIVTYTHYPMVSGDMLAKTSLLGPKHYYWRLLMGLYTLAGSFVNVPIANGSWTYNHMKRLWTLAGEEDRAELTKLYPPCATQDWSRDVVLSADNVRNRLAFVYLAQFRPEKRHSLVLEQFAQFKHAAKGAADRATLVLIGSVRNDDDKSLVYKLRLQARELELTEDNISFVLDAPWTTIQDILSHASVGINAMWNEHFGMSVVEYMAAGLIPVAHNSAGPMMDVVVAPDSTADRPGLLFEHESDPDYAARKTHAPSLADCLASVIAMSDDQTYKMRVAAFDQAQRFSDQEFARQWSLRMLAVTKLEQYKRAQRRSAELYD